MNELNSSDKARPKFSFTKEEFVPHLLKLAPKMRKVRKEIEEFLATDHESLEEVKIPELIDIKNDFEKICSVPHRRIGTNEAHEIENFIEEEFKKYGLKGVKKEPIDMINWVAFNWKLVVEKGEEIIEIPSFYMLNSGFTNKTGVTAPLIYVGIGGAEDFKGKDIKDKIVVIDIELPSLPLGLMKKEGMAYYFIDPNDSMKPDKKVTLVFLFSNFSDQPYGQPINRDSLYWRAVDGGALGLILILRDFPANINTHWGPYDGLMKPVPALYVSKIDGIKIREMAQSGGARGTIILEGYKEPSVAHNIMGILPGKSKETIMISSHHDSPFKGASEDGTGVTNVLAQIRTWAKVPLEKRPRTILFVATTGHHYGGIGAIDFAIKHRDNLLKNVLIDLNLEHLCAKEVEEDPQTNKFRFTNNIAIGAVFVPETKSIIFRTIKALIRNKIENLMVIPNDYFGTLPIGEAGNYVYYGNIKTIHWIRLPYYLLTAEDTIDKIDMNKFPSAVQCVADLINSFMFLPKEEF